MQELLAALTTQAMIKMLHLALDNPRATRWVGASWLGSSSVEEEMGVFWQLMSQQYILMANWAQGNVHQEVQ